MIWNISLIKGKNDRDGRGARADLAALCSKAHRDDTKAIAHAAGARQHGWTAASAVELSLRTCQPAR